MTKETFLKFASTIPQGAVEEHGSKNAAIMHLWKQRTGQTDFRTFKEWKESGRKVKPGESSYPVFSRPINKIKAEEQNSSDSYERNFYGICHLFHIEQTDPIK
jgi:hypothetical protein